MVAGLAVALGATIPGTTGVAVGLIGGFIGGYLDREMGLFGRSQKPGDFQGAQVEGLSAGTPFVYCIGHRNRVAGQRLWTSELVRTQAASIDKRGDQTPEVIRASWATAVCANPATGITKGWLDGDKVYELLDPPPPLTVTVGQVVKMDWWTTYLAGGGSGPGNGEMERWHLVIDTLTEPDGRAVAGAPDLTQFAPRQRINLTVDDPAHGIQVSRKSGQTNQTPWIVLASEKLPKGNSRLVIQLLFDDDPNRQDLDFGWFQLGGAEPGDPFTGGPFKWVSTATGPTSGSTLTFGAIQTSAWREGFLRDPDSDFEVRLGSPDQLPFNSMLAALGGDAEHFPAFTCASIESASVSSFGTRVPNSEWLVAASGEINIDSAIEIVMRDRLGFRDQTTGDPEFDATALRSGNPAGIEPPPVHGYQWPAGLTGYEIMQPLMMVGGVRVHERGGRAIFDYLARRDIADLVVGDLDARPFGDRPSDRGVIETEPAAELDAPDEINVHFADVDNDNQKQVAAAVRQGIRIGNQDVIREDVRLENMAMTYERASGLSQDLLREAWERRDGARIRLPLTWDYLEPGDVIRMAGNDAPGGGPWLLAIDRIERGDMLEIECFVLSSPPIDAQSAGSTFDRDQPQVQSAAPLAFDVIDLGPLRDEHATTPGYYVAASRFAPSNSPAGGNIWRKAPDESNPHRVGPIRELAVMGSTVYVDGSTNLLGDAAADVIDEANTIDVDVFDGSLASVTEAELLAGANRCVIGDEILAFRDAVALDTGPRRFRLSGLLRGLNGTTGAILGHQAGERFVFLGHRSDPLPVNFVPAPLADVGTTHQVQAVHSGGSTDTASEYPHTVEASTGRSLPPYDLTADVQENGDVVFHWFRRSRIEWDSLDDPPMLESAERYELVLAGGARIKTVEGDPNDPANLATRTYTVAEQTADVLGLTFTAEVRQVDPAAGPGRSASISVTP